jgi:hypothetical protein
MKIPCSAEIVQHFPQYNPCICCTDQILIYRVMHYFWSLAIYTRNEWRSTRRPVAKATFVTFEGGGLAPSLSFPLPSAGDYHDVGRKSKLKSQRMRHPVYLCVQVQCVLASILQKGFLRLLKIASSCVLVSASSSFRPIILTHTRSDCH